MLFRSQTPTGLATVAGDAGANAAAKTGIASLMPETLGGKIAAGTAGIGLASMLADRGRYGVPEQEKYSGPLSRFSYDPSRYEPYTYKPYAQGGLTALSMGGGPVEQMSNANAVGANTGFPMADINRGGCIGHAGPWFDDRLYCACLKRFGRGVGRSRAGVCISCRDRYVVFYSVLQLLGYVLQKRRRLYDLILGCIRS